MALVTTLLGFLVFMTLMAIGVLLGRKPIAGSCGGLANVGIDGECKICGKSKEEACPSLESLEAPTTSSDLFIDAMKNNSTDALQKAQKTHIYKGQNFKDPLDF